MGDPVRKVTFEEVVRMTRVQRAEHYAYWKARSPDRSSDPKPAAKGTDDRPRR